jgi:hypothetical protein
MGKYLLTLYLDFDAFKSVIQTENEYILTPVFKVFNQDEAGRITGTVFENGEGVPGVIVEATSQKYSTATFSDQEGNYTLIIPSGTYTISAQLPSGLSTAVTDGIQVLEMETIEGVDLSFF